MKLFHKSAQQGHFTLSLVNSPTTLPILAIQIYGQLLNCDATPSLISVFGGTVMNRAVIFISPTGAE